MRTPIIIHPRNSGPSTGASSYSALSNARDTGSWASSESNSRTPIPYDGVLSNLTVYFPTPLTQGSYTIAIRKNGVTQSQTNVVIDTVTSKASSTGSVSVTAGDEITIVVIPSGTPTAQTNTMMSLTFDGTAAGKSVAFAHFTSNNTATFSSMQISHSTVESNIKTYMPISGVIDSMYVRLGTSPGVGNARTVTLRKNGLDTGISLTISDTGTINNISGSVSVAKGDLITIGQTISGTPTTTSLSIGFGFTPTIDGESFAISQSNSSVSASVTVYLSASGYSSSSGETNVTSVLPCAVTIRKLYATVSVAPTGATRTRTFTVRKGSNPAALTDTTLTCVITNTETANEDSVHSEDLAAGDFLTTVEVPVNSPSTGIISASIAMFIDPNAAGYTPKGFGGQMLGLAA